MINIDKLVAVADENSRRFTVDKRLLLLGAEDSRFLRGLRGKSRKMGFEANIVSGKADTTGYAAMVVDRETYTPGLATKGFPDIDGDFPASGQAIFTALIAESLVTGKHIGLLGGKSLGYLDYALHQQGAAVTLGNRRVPYSRTLSGLDVLILAVPEVNQVIPTDVKDVVIDLGGVADPGSFSAQYIGPEQIGRFVTSILVNRFCNRYGRIRQE